MLLYISIVHCLQLGIMSDYYVGESVPPPLPPPRNNPNGQNTSVCDYDFLSENVFQPLPSSNIGPPLPTPLPKARQGKPPPPLPKKSTSVSNEPVATTQMSPSRMSKFSASLQSTLNPLFPKKQSPVRDVQARSFEKPKRASSYDASSSPHIAPQVPLTPPLRLKAPLPPVPSNKYTPSPPLKEGQEDYDDTQDYEDVELPQSFQMESYPSDGMNLLQFINKNQDRFPVPFEVSLGFSAGCEEASISEGERFIANFLKRCKVLTVEDNAKELYSIPLNTSFQFALLHDPNANKKEAMTGFVFKTAGDLMITRSLPKVIRARKAFRGVSPESSVSLNELLYVKEVVQKEGNRHYVKCVQASTGKEKQLHKECLGEFSTSPHDIREYLPNLLKHFQLPFKAVMCLGIDNEEDIPPHLVSAVVTVSNLRTEESLITTTVTDDSDDASSVVPETSSVILNDIPLSYDVNVHPLNITPLINEKMIVQTEFIFQNFNPAKVFPYMANHSSSQLALMKSVRKDVNMHGVELIESKLLKERHFKQSQLESSSADSLVEISKVSAQLRSLEDRIGKLEQKVTAQAKSMSELRQAQLSVLTSQSTCKYRN